MSGRGLGHTGGTLDKLEAIPGFRVELTTERVRRAGARRSASRSSARRPSSFPPTSMLYGLRDVTATVDQLSLIAASIMSKKLAAGAQAIVLDVKVGDGAFMKTLEDARALAEAMLALGERGRARGRLPAHRHGPAARRRRRQRARGARGARHRARRRARRTSPSSCSTPAPACSRSPTSAIDVAEGRAPRGGRGRRRIAPRRCGTAGSRRRAARPTSRRSSSAPIVREVAAPRAGTVEQPRRDPRRRTPRSTSARAGASKSDAIDHAVGVVCLRKRGDAVGAGEVLAEVHARDESAAERPSARSLAPTRSATAPPRSARCCSR